MRRTGVFLISLIVALLVSPLFAAVGESYLSSVTMILTDIFGLFCLLVAVFLAWDIYTNYKGGELALPWGFIAGGIIFFGFGKILESGESVGFWSMIPLLRSIIYTLVALFLLVGILLYRKSVT